MELAEKLNVSRQAISRWEVGAAIPSIDNLVVLSKLYCVSVDYLLNDGIVNFADVSDENDAADYMKKPCTPNWLVCMCTVLILIAGIVIGRYAISEFRRDDLGDYPMDDMSVIDANNGYSVGTFAFE